MTGHEKAWFITGTSRGFGRIWAEAALKRGDKVTATARDTSTLAPLTERYGEENVLTLELDVDSKAAVDVAVARAVERFGRLDVTVNNAGYGHFGMVEEVTEAEARQQIETNLFGALWVTQAVLPQMREQGAGHIIQVSSIGGVNAFPGFGLYNASKWGLEAFSQSLHQEVGEFGIHVTLVEPIGFPTDWSGPSAKRSERIAAYDGAHERRRQQGASWKPGDPEATAQAMLELVDAAKPPLRCFFGEWALDMMRREYADRIALWEEWQSVAVKAHG